MKRYKWEQDQISHMKVRWFELLLFLHLTIAILHCVNTFKQDVVQLVENSMDLSLIGISHTNPFLPSDISNVMVYAVLSRKVHIKHSKSQVKICF